MPAEDLIVEKPVKKSLTKLPLFVHKKVIHALDEIQNNPLSGEKLHGELRDYYKFRVGDYRIVCQFDAKRSMVIILKIEHRQGVYR